MVLASGEGAARAAENTGPGTRSRRTGPATRRLPRDVRQPRVGAVAGECAASGAPQAMGVGADAVAVGAAQKADPAAVRPARPVAWGHRRLGRPPVARGPLPREDGLEGVVLWLRGRASPAELLEAAARVSAFLGHLWARPSLAAQEAVAVAATALTPKLVALPSTPLPDVGRAGVPAEATGEGVPRHVLLGVYEGDQSRWEHVLPQAAPLRHEDLEPLLEAHLRGDVPGDRRPVPELPLRLQAH